MYRQNPEVKHFLPMVQFLITNNLTNKEDLLKEMEDIVEKFERRDRIEFMVKYAIYLWWLKNKNEEIKNQYEQKLSKIIPLYETGPHNLFPRWEQIKDLFKHYVDQGKIRGFNTLANTTWANKSASQLWRELEEIQTGIQDEIEKKDKSKILARADQGVTMIKFENGWRWTYLDNYQDEEEALLMDHCGTGEFDEDGRLLSLRDENNMPQITAAVFPLVNNKEQSLFVLGQIKGKKNNKPDFSKFGIFLEALYRDPRILWATNNSLEDFNFKEKFPEIENDKPGMFNLAKYDGKIGQLISQAEHNPEFVGFKGLLEKIYPLIIWKYIRNAHYYYPRDEEKIVKMEHRKLAHWIFRVFKRNISPEDIGIDYNTLSEILSNIYRDILLKLSSEDLVKVAIDVNNTASKSKRKFIRELSHEFEQTQNGGVILFGGNLAIVKHYLTTENKRYYIGDFKRMVEKKSAFNYKKLWPIVEKFLEIKD